MIWMIYEISGWKCFSLERDQGGGAGGLHGLLDLRGKWEIN